MRNSTIVNLFTAWFLCYTANSMGSVSAGTTMNRHPNLMGLPSSPMNKNNDFGCPGCKLSSNKLSFLQKATSLALLNTRGGADDSDFEDDSYDDEESEDEEDLFGDFELDGDDVDDFKEDNQMDRFIEEYHRTPPLTKA